MSNKIFYGIDLGTTNSSISFAVEDESKGKINVNTIPLKLLDVDGSLKTTDLLPSFFYKDGNVEYVGEYAKGKRQTSPNNVIQSVKIDMGSEKKYFIAGEEFTPVEISAKFLSELKRQAKTSTRLEVKEAIIAVPANFDHQMRRATLEAAKRAGFEVLESDGTFKQDVLIDEPHAVLYDLLHRQQSGEFPKPLIPEDRESVVLVYDFGGGTLDVSMYTVSVRKDKLLDVKPIAIGRYTEIGGDSFDIRVRDWIKEEFLKENPNIKWENLSDYKKVEFLTRALIAAEQAKYELVRLEQGVNLSGSAWGAIIGSTEPTAMLSTGFLVGNKTFSRNITKEDYKEIVKNLLGLDFDYNDHESLGIFRSKEEKNNIVFPVLDVLNKASKKLGEVPPIDLVLCSGGMTNFSIIRERIKELLNIEPFQISDPEKAVSRGAAIYGVYRSKGIMNVTTLAETLSLEIEGGFTTILAEAGIALPYKHEVEEFFVIPKSGTQQIALPIYKGEEERASENIKLKSFIFDLDKPYPKGTRISIEVDVDRNKIVTLRAWITENPNVKFEGVIKPEDSKDIGLQKQQSKEKQPVKNEEGIQIKYPPIDVEAVLNKYLAITDRNTEAGLRELETKLANAPNGKDAIPKLWKKYNSNNVTNAGLKRIPMLMSKIYKKHPNEPFKKEFSEKICKILNSDMLLLSQRMQDELFGAIWAVAELEIRKALPALRRLIRQKMIRNLQDAVITLGKVGYTIEDLDLTKEIFNEAFQKRKKGLMISSAWSIGKLASRELKPPIPRSEFYGIIDKLANQAMFYSKNGRFNNSMLRNVIFAFGEMADSRNSNEFHPTQKRKIIGHLADLQSSLSITVRNATEIRQKEIGYLLGLMDTVRKMIRGEQLTEDEERTLLAIRSNIDLS